MLMTWNPRWHRVTNHSDTELSRWVSREFPDVRGLFVYFHQDAGNWVIARWHNRTAGEFYDVFVVGPSLGGFTRYNALEVRKRLRQPYESRQMAERIRDESYREKRRMTDESMTDAERRRKRKIQVMT